MEIAAIIFLVIGLVLQIVPKLIIFILTINKKKGKVTPDGAKQAGRGSGEGEK